MSKQSIGKQIKDSCKVLNVRQEDLAEILDVVLRTIVLVEHGEVNSSLETLLKIAKVLGLELQMIVKL